MNEIKICSTVEVIAFDAFAHCQRLAKVNLEESSPSPHQRKEVPANVGLLSCTTKNPDSFVCQLNCIALQYCSALSEADLSTTTIADIYAYVFDDCKSLQTVSLPNSLERIQESAYAFEDCSCFVVTVLASTPGFPAGQDLKKILPSMQMSCQPGVSRSIQCHGKSV